jgi:hypothetical protein
MDWPDPDGLSEDVIAAVVLAALTVWLRADDVDPPLFPVPAYTAVIESAPTGRVEVVSVALLLRPLPGVSIALPIDVAPFMNVTEPVGAA